MLIAAINFDLSGTTKIGKYVPNHSFMIPGVVATSVAVVTGLFLARMVLSTMPGGAHRRPAAQSAVERSRARSHAGQ